MIITLLGYMGSGKSTIGQQLASVLNYEFIDLDHYIEQKEKSSVTTLFKDKGEIYFRRKENTYLKEIITEKNNTVLSLGGGTPCYANNMELLKSDTIISIYLKLSPTSLVDRLFNEKEDRPLISHLATKEAMQEFIAIHLFERQNFYQKATVALKVDGLSPKTTVERIVNTLY